jgi:hypothetical protein
MCQIFFGKQHTILFLTYLPPPAHAHAHPAQAQAQAHPPEGRPPPLVLWKDLPDVVDCGMGLVLLVILSVKLVRFPTTLVEKLCTVPTTEAAASEPARWGMRTVVMLLPPPWESLEAEAVLVPEETELPVRGMLGSARHHHQGMKTGPLPNTRRVRWS